MEPVQQTVDSKTLANAMLNGMELRTARITWQLKDSEIFEMLAAENIEYHKLWKHLQQQKKEIAYVACKKLCLHLKRLPTLKEIKGVAGTNERPEALLARLLSDSMDVNNKTSSLVKMKAESISSPAPSKRDREREILLLYLKQKAAELGRSPSIYEMRLDRQHPYIQYFTHFGGLRYAMELAGLKSYMTYKKEKRREFKIALLNELKSIYNNKARIPCEADLHPEGIFTLANYNKEFGSLRNACRKIGIIFKFEHKPNPFYSENNILNHLKELALKLGHTPRIIDVLHAKVYSVQLYRRRCGSFTAALKKAGLPVRTWGPKFTKEQMLDHLIMLADITGHIPKKKHIQTNGLIPYQSYFIYFGSLTNALKQAGLIKY